MPLVRWQHQTSAPRHAGAARKIASLRRTWGSGAEGGGIILDTAQACLFSCGTVTPKKKQQQKTTINLTKGS